MSCRVNNPVSQSLGVCRFFLLISLLLVSFLTVVEAQDITLHGGTSVVLVPTLVTNIAGEPIFGLTAADFTVYDNGVEQKLQLDEETLGVPTSVVVAVQKGHSAGETLDKIKRLGSLLYPIVGEGRGEVAIVAFDDKPELKLDFTANLDLATKALNQIALGSYGSAVLDAVAFSVEMLDSRPAQSRKVLLLVSGANDDGSRATIPEVMRQIERSNILIYSATYSQAKSSKIGQAIADPTDHPVNILGALTGLMRSAKENVPKTVAQMSGGEYLPFHDEKALEGELSDVNNHFFNQYLLSFTPKRLSPGQHSLRVAVAGHGDFVVTARTGYWVGDAPLKDTAESK